MRMMTKNPIMERGQRPWLRWLLLGLLALCGSAAQAQSCWNGGKSDLIFDPVAVGSTVDATGTVELTCQASWLLPATFRVCVYAAGYPGAANIAPRLMSNNGTDGQPERFMPYNLYSNIARTNILGPKGNGSYSAYVLTFSVPAATTQTVTIPIYGRATASAGLPGGHTFYAYSNTVTVDWAGGLLTPISCDTVLLAARGTATFGLQAQATTINSCVVAIASASDMDFGSHASLASAWTGTSTITLDCPSNTTWQLGLSNGLHALGTQRRMAGPGGDFVNYELYRDAARTQRWGSTLGGDTYPKPTTATNPMSLTVYGRVPAQPDVTPGVYIDTITVTLTY